MNWKRLKGKNPEGKNFRKLLRRKLSSAEISRISRNTIKSSQSDIFYLQRNLLKYLLRTFFSSAKFSEVFALCVFTLWLFPIEAPIFLRDLSQACERGGPLQKHKTPIPPKVLGRVLGEVPARNGVLGEVLGKVLVLLALLRARRTSTFPSTSPSTPFLAGTSPSTFGGWGFCASVGGRPVRNPKLLAALCGIHPYLSTPVLWARLRGRN